MLHVQNFVFGLLQENCYLLWDDSGECALVDPGACETAEKDRLKEFIARKMLRPAMVLLTHAHLDHICGVDDLVRSYGIPVMMDPREVRTMEEFNPSLAAYGLPLPGKFEFKELKDNDVLHFGDTDIKVISTPGHSPGGLCFLAEKDRVLFTGDTLFAGSIGRTDNNCASLDDLTASILDRLMHLPGDIYVYPGHGPATTIARERSTNPFIFNDETEG